VKIGDVHKSELRILKGSLVSTLATLNDNERIHLGLDDLMQRHHSTATTNDFWLQLRSFKRNRLVILMENFHLSLACISVLDGVCIISVALLSCEWHHAAFILPLPYQHARIFVMGFALWCKFSER
jgi:hypothetical protein